VHQPIALGQDCPVNPCAVCGKVDPGQLLDTSFLKYNQGSCHVWTDKNTGVVLGCTADASQCNRNQPYRTLSGECATGKDDSVDVTVDKCSDAVSKWLSKLQCQALKVECNLNDPRPGYIGPNGYAVEGRETKCTAHSDLCFQAVPTLPLKKPYCPAGSTPHMFPDSAYDFLVKFDSRSQIGICKWDAPSGGPTQSGKENGTTAGTAGGP
jgi:hypothetical protein